MESPGLQLLAESAENGQLLLIGGYNPYLLFLAWLVACTACVATLNLLDRAANAEKTAARTIWRWIAVACLTIGIWAMHSICILAFDSPLEARYGVVIALGSLLIALIIVQTLDNTTAWRPNSRLLHQLFKYALCMLAAGGLLSTHLLIGNTLAGNSDAGSNNWQPALVLAVITLLLIGS